MSMPSVVPAFTAAVTTGLLCVSLPQGARAFAQAVPRLSCVGHEEITRYSATRVAGQLALTHDVDKLSGCGSSCPKFGATNFYVYSAIIGQRWVDLMGFPGLPRTLGKKCLDATAQDHDDVQYDHALRKRCDVGHEGLRRAINGTRERITLYFDQALQALRASPEAIITVTDGGTTQQSVKVNKAFFLFGRAIHPLQDSYSPEHTVRDLNSADRRLVDVKTYVCTAGAALHAHSSSGPAPGDVIQTNCSLNAPGHLRPDSVPLTRHATVAAVVMEDFWKAFLKKDRAEFARQLDKHLRYDPNSRLWVATPAQTAECKRGVDENNVQEAWRSFCLKRTGQAERGKPPFAWSNAALNVPVPSLAALALPRPVPSCPATGSSSQGAAAPTAPAPTANKTAAPKKTGVKLAGVRDPASNNKKLEAETVALVANATAWDNPTKARKSRPLKKGTEVIVLEGKKLQNRDKTFVWCEIQQPENDAEWIRCDTLPAAYRKK